MEAFARLILEDFKEFARVSSCSFSAMAVCWAAACNPALAHNPFAEIPNRNGSRRRKKWTVSSDAGSKPCPRRSLANSLGGCGLNASEPAEEEHKLEQDSLPPDLGHALPANLSWLWSLSSVADDSSPDPLSPPTGFRSMGVIFELEGVIVEDDDPELEPHAWFILCEEEGKEFPMDVILRSIKGMKTEEAISEVLGWSKDPSVLQRLATRKEEIYWCLRGSEYCLRSGSQQFLNRLVDYGVPMAVVSARPRRSIEEAIQAVGLEGYFVCVVAAEDLGRGKPDPEMFKRAAELLDLESEHCIVIGNSDSTVVAAASAGMSSVVVSSNRPVYEFRVAPRVVRWLDELSIGYLENSTRINPIQQRASERHMEVEGLSYL